MTPPPALAGSGLSVVAAPKRDSPAAGPPGESASTFTKTPLTILCVDDSLTNRLLLDAILAKEGHRVVQAEDGRQAVAACHAVRPDLIIMDVMMPGMDGYEATRLIKAACGDRFVPVIFLTAASNEAQLAACIASGGDDFMTKPLNRLILLSKVHAMTRLREMHELAQAQARELSDLNGHLLHEQEVAKRVYASVMRSAAFAREDIRHRLTPASIMSGDLLLAAEKPDGSVCAMLGDFTGHGLAAAAGALPAAEAFLSMAHKNYGIDRIAWEINRKLRTILPTGLFCAACLIEFNPAQGRLAVWNGGIPDALLFRHDHGISHRFPSTHLPLGLHDPSAFDSELSVHEVHPGDHLLLSSDGIIEATNAVDDRFGQARLEACLTPGGAGPIGFEVVNRALADFCGETIPRDDIALFELRCTFPTAEPVPVQSAGKGEPVGEAVSSRESWRLEFEFGPDLLRTVDPLPQVIRSTEDFPGFPRRREQIVMVISELLNNAVDHGILGLDSAMKATPEGFAAYYEERARRLKTLQTGWLLVRLTGPADRFQRLTIHVEDSGPGFDHRRYTDSLAANRGFSGRGLALVHSLCNQVTYWGNGNCVEARYTWT